MNFQRLSTDRRGAWKLLLALVCIVLVFVCGTVQAVHTHPAGDISHADCPLCALAHAPVQVAAQSAPLHFTPVVSFVEVAGSPVRVRTLTVFALYTRPPPADALSA